MPNLARIERTTRYLVEPLPRWCDTTEGGNRHRSCRNLGHGLEKLLPVPQLLALTLLPVAGMVGLILLGHALTEPER